MLLLSQNATVVLLFFFNFFFCMVLFIEEIFLSFSYISRNVLVMTLGKLCVY